MLFLSFIIITFMWLTVLQSLKLKEKQLLTLAEDKKLELMNKQLELELKQLEKEERLQREKSMREW